MEIVYVGFSEILESIFKSQERLLAVKFVADIRHELSLFKHSFDDGFMDVSSIMICDNMDVSSIMICDNNETK